MIMQLRFSFFCSIHVFSIVIKCFHVGSKKPLKKRARLFHRFCFEMTPFISLENGGLCPPKAHAKEYFLQQLNGDSHSLLAN